MLLPVWASSTIPDNNLNPGLHWTAPGCSWAPGGVNKANDLLGLSPGEPAALAPLLGRLRFRLNR